MIRLSYASFHTVWFGRDRFEALVDHMAATGELPEVALKALGFEGSFNWVRLGDVTPEDCPLKAFWKVVQTGDPLKVRHGKVVLMRLFDKFEVPTK